jgi:hypothetical protein
LEKIQNLTHLSKAFMIDQHANKPPIKKKLSTGFS